MVHALAGGQLLALALAVPLVGWGVYRRVHRNITRQPVQPRRLTLRGIFVAVALTALTFLPPFDPAVALAMLLGCAVGVTMALYGLRLTRFETTTAGQFYTPNLYLGIGISLLFVARMGYRIYVLWPILLAGTMPVLGVYARSPLTYGMLAVVLGYFATYYLGIVRRARRLPVSVEAAPAA